MRNINLMVITILTALVFALAPVATASEPIESDSSAVLKDSQNTSEAYNKHIKIKAIERVLQRYNSPLVSEAEIFVVTAEALDLEPYLLPSIAGVESGFGSRYIKSTHNVFGYGVGRIPFDNFADGIATVGYALRFKYINRGAETLAQVGHRYAGGSTTWASKVQTYMNAFEREELKLRRIELLSS